MRKIYLAILILTNGISCQMEDENPGPEDSFVKFYGDFAEHEASDVELSADSTGLVVFGTQQVEGGSRDYYLAVMDGAGNLLRDTTYGFEGGQVPDPSNPGNLLTLSAGTKGEEVAAQVEVLSDGYLIIGTTTVNDAAQNVIDYSFITYAFVDPDDLSLTSGLLALINDSTNTRDLFGNDVIRLSDGNFLMVGAEETATDLDFFYRKFSRDNGTIWQRRGGLNTAGADDVLIRALETDNGNIALFGYSEDLGEEGELLTNVTYWEITPNAVQVNSNSGGVLDVYESGTLTNSFLDVPASVVEKPGGYLVVGTSTSNNDGSQYAFFMDISSNGNFNERDTINTNFRLGQDRLQTLGTGVTTTATNDLVVVGTYPNFRTDSETRGSEAMFVRLNQVGENVEGVETNFGLGDGDDSAVDALTLPDGKIVVLTNVDFGGGVKMMSLIKLNDTGEIDN